MGVDNMLFFVAFACIFIMVLCFMWGANKRNNKYQSELEERIDLEDQYKFIQEYNKRKHK